MLLFCVCVCCSSHLERIKINKYFGRESFPHESISITIVDTVSESFKVSQNKTKQKKKKKKKKPYHDSQEVKCIGHITTPWPCFMIAVRTEVLEENHELIHRLLVAISESCELFIKEKATGESIQHVSKTYGQKIEDVCAWFETVSYAQDCSNISSNVISNCVQTLKKARVIDSQSPEDPQVYVDSRVTTLV